MLIKIFIGTIREHDLIKNINFKNTSKRETNMRYEIGKKRIINENFSDMKEEIVRWEVLKIKKEQTIHLKIISMNSKYMQGIRFAIDVGNGFLEIDYLKSKDIYFVVNENNMEGIIRCYSEEGLLSIYNIYYRTDDPHSMCSQMDFSGMIIEKTDNNFTFRCNDTGYKTTFDSLVFEITLE